MSGMIVKYGKDYNLIKSLHGDKLYIPVVYAQTRRHLCHRGFTRARDALDYRRKLLERYERLKDGGEDERDRD